MFRFISCATRVSALAVLTGLVHGAAAHPGHPSPASVNPDQHLHLAAGLVVSGEVLLLAVAGISALALAWRVTRRQRRRSRA